MWKYALVFGAAICAGVIIGTGAFAEEAIKLCDTRQSIFDRNPGAKVVDLTSPQVAEFIKENRDSIPKGKEPVTMSVATQPKEKADGYIWLFGFGADGCLIGKGAATPEWFAKMISAAQGAAS
jgi:hypothetical protein